MSRLLLASSILLTVAIMALAQQSRAEADMAAAAKRLLGMLDPGQTATIRWPFDSEERFNWHFVPRERNGLSVRAMTEPQREAAFGLLRASLSASGYRKVETIRSLENVLRELEQSARRDPELYYFTIFGDPGSHTWGWRYEGHHISQNWTIVHGRVSATTPAFLGANPAVVQAGPLEGTRPLAAEEKLARALLNALTDSQRLEAITAQTAPGDIFSGNRRKAAILENAGLQASTMTEAQQALLMRLIEEHASAQPPALAEQRLAKVRADGLANIRFAWMGSALEGPGHGHYYRIQGKSFLIEYDNVQTNANHQHIVWRDFAGDFGLDVLAEHHAGDPEHAQGAARSRTPQ